ncbi:MAG TPA: hypothetical protein VN961_23125, partial [Streptosporangiaceae bacterium]|nr:hypothetical protein [Streptosporangiaceae bacterium]
MKKARPNGVRGKGRTSRSVFLGRDARHATADYLETERPATPTRTAKRCSSPPPRSAPAGRAGDSHHVRLTP